MTQDRFYNLSNSTISVNDFNVTAGSLFVNRYDANINAESFNVTAADNFYNTDNSTISAMILLSLQILLAIIIQEEMVILMRIH